MRVTYPNGKFLPGANQNRRYQKPHVKLPYKVPLIWALDCSFICSAHVHCHHRRFRSKYILTPGQSDCIRYIKFGPPFTYIEGFKPRHIGVLQVHWAGKVKVEIYTAP